MNTHIQPIYNPYTTFNQDLFSVSFRYMGALMISNEYPYTTHIQPKIKKLYGSSNDVFNLLILVVYGSSNDL